MCEESTAPVKITSPSKASQKCDHWYFGIKSQTRKRDMWNSVLLVQEAELRKGRKVAPHT